MPSAKRLLIASHVFVPDPAAVGQYLAEVAVEMVRRGHRVTVLTSDRGYDDPGVRYPARENLRGVDVWRLPLTSFGKRRMPLRVAGTASFMAQATLRALLARPADGVLFSTTPPLVGVPMALATAVRRIPMAFWAMDLNPDQLVALGRLPADARITRALATANRAYLERSALVVALDRYMADRLRSHGSLEGKVSVIPPWPLENLSDLDVPGAADSAHERNPFRLEHGLEGKLVVMYSGNHTTSNPLDTLVEAASRLREDDRLRFVFVGGGQGKVAVERAIRSGDLHNVLSVPYQPLAKLPDSLAAADVHVVSLGNPMVGIVHPSKVYGAMAVGRPILYLGPRRSHVGDLLDEAKNGVQIEHGNVEGMVAAIQRLATLSSVERDVMGERGRALLRARLGRDALCGKFCDLLEERLAF